MDKLKRQNRALNPIASSIVLLANIVAFAGGIDCKNCDTVSTCESYTGKRTALFGSWIEWIEAPCPTANRNRNTRAVVLSARSLDSTTGDCTIKHGKWIDPYTDSVYLDAHALQIDHVVPLDEAYISGAYKWTRKDRVSFANDTSVLNITSRHQNESKGSKDVAEWLPPKNQKEYYIKWAQIKRKYNLVADSSELDVLRKYVSKDELPKLGTKVLCTGSSDQGQAMGK